MAVQVQFSLLNQFNSWTSNSCKLFLKTKN